MSKVYFEVFDEKRLKIFNLLPGLINKWALLTGGTALALQIGHRRSFDFDICQPDEIEPDLLVKVNKVLRNFKVRPVVDTKSELSLILDETTKLSFFKFPFASLHKPEKIGSLRLYSPKDLASNKAYVIGRRGEWKDYVDLYFLLKEQGLKIQRIIKEAKKRFAGNFDEKLFWEQLVYWDDLGDFKVEYLRRYVPEEKIKEYFRRLVKDRFRKARRK